MEWHNDSFRVNLWVSMVTENDGTPDIRWLGSVEHLPTSRSVYFTDLSELVAFLARYAPALLPDQRTRSQSSVN